MDCKYKEIYLIPDPEYGHLWCEDPAPGDGMDEGDAVKYIRADLVEKTEQKYKDVLKKIVAAHHQSSVDWDAVREAESLLVNCFDISRPVKHP
jgi:hypothetical protein